MKFSNGILKIPLIAAICFAYLILSPFSSIAKNLTYAEYFIDTDPGQGKATSISPCDGKWDEATEEFCINNILAPSLLDGRHTFYLRLKDSDNKWGMRQLDFYYASSSPYASKTITAAEYFIDNDPGQGNGIALVAADGALNEANEYLLTEGIESSDLTLGKHSLFVRVKDSYNVWSMPRRVDFNVDSANSYKKITAAEYFIDNDPGDGKAILLSATDGAFDESKEDANKQSISTTALTPGSHIISARFKDNWSYYPKFDGWGLTSDSILCVVEMPKLESPSDGFKMTDTTVIFKWATLAQVDSYEIQIASSALFKDTISMVSSTMDTLFVHGLPPDSLLHWRIRGIYSCGVGPWSGPRSINTPPLDVRDRNVNQLPELFELSQNFPNPFNPSTSIEFALPRAGDVNIKIYNILGEEVKTLVSEHLAAGYKSVDWDGRGSNGLPVASGIYLYRIQAGDFTDTKKMVLLK